MLLVPISLLLPANVLFQKGYVITTIGGKPFTTYELATVLIAIGLIILGTRLRWQILAASGSAGMAVFLFRATIYHFEKYTSWPLALAITGGVAMLVAWVLALRRMRREHRALMGAAPAAED